MPSYFQADVSALHYYSAMPMSRQANVFVLVTDKRERERSLRHVDIVRWFE